MSSGECQGYCIWGKTRPTDLFRGRPSRRSPPASSSGRGLVCGKMADPHGEERRMRRVSGRCYASPGETMRPDPVCAICDRPAANAVRAMRLYERSCDVGVGRGKHRQNAHRTAAAGPSNERPTFGAIPGSAWAPYDGLPSRRALRAECRHVTVYQCLLTIISRARTGVALVLAARARRGRATHTGCKINDRCIFRTYFSQSGTGYFQVAANLRHS